VHVTHQGEPHPKGFSAVIVSTSCGRIDGETREMVIDSAIDYCKGKTPKLFVGECPDPVDPKVPPATDLGEEKPGNAPEETSPAAVGSASSTPATAESAGVGSQSDTPVTPAS